MGGGLSRARGAVSALPAWLSSTCREAPGIVLADPDGKTGWRVGLQRLLSAAETRLARRLVPVPWAPAGKTPPGAQT